MSDTTKQQPVPAIRTAPSAGLVHFGLTTYTWSSIEDIPLGYTATPKRARAIAEALMAAADDAEAIAVEFPKLAPVDATTAILTTAGPTPGNESVRGDELRDDTEDHGETH